MNADTKDRTWDDRSVDLEKRQSRLLKTLKGSSIKPARYEGLVDCNRKKCARANCLAACAFGEWRRRSKQLPEVHDLFARATTPLFEVRLVKAAWVRPIGKLRKASIIAAKQLNRRALDVLYNPEATAVGLFKASISSTVKTCQAGCYEKLCWVCEIHQLVSDIDEQADLERVFAGESCHEGFVDVLAVRPVTDLDAAIARIFSSDLETWQPPFRDAPEITLKRRHRAEYYGWLLRQSPDARIIRYGVDRHFNKLKKKPRIFRPKVRKPRPYPVWLEHHMFGRGKWADLSPHSMEFDMIKNRR